MIRRHRTKDGTSYRVRVGNGPQRSFHRLKDAQEYEERQRNTRRRARAGLDYEAGPITFDALCEEFLSGYDAKSKQWTERMLVYSRTKFGNQFVRAIRPEHISQWLHALDLSPKTKSHILERMRLVLNAGIEWGYLSRSPARGQAVRTPGRGRLEEIHPFESWQDVERTAEAAATFRPTFGEFIRFGCGTGLRPGELLVLKHQHIDVPNRIVSVPGTKNRNAQRSVPLMRNAIPTRGLPHVNVFQINYHRFRQHWWPKALKLAGLEYRPPGQMRHTFATLALQQGIPIDVVSKWLGHSSVDITLRYYARYTRPVIDRNLALLDTLGESAIQQEEAQ